MWQDYVFNKKTYAQIAKDKSISLKTVQRRLDQYEVAQKEIPPRRVMVVMDTKFFGSKKGLVVFRDCWKKQNLLWNYVATEKVYYYQEGINRIKQKGFKIQGIIADGKPGVLNSFNGIPTQMCHFHQKQIVRTYLTQRPKLEAGIGLKAIVSRLTITDRDSFTGWLREWHNKWDTFLKEKTYRDDRSWGYTHRRLRSAYFSLIRHLPHLFTYHHHKDMPNTTNSLEGTFSQIEAKLRVHQGLKWDRKKRVVDSLLIESSRTKG